MTRRFQSWLLFAVFSAAVLGGMGWVTSSLLELSRENMETRQRVWVERTVRDALWRMDAEVSGIILEEASRPYSDYWAFNGPGQVLHLPELDQVQYVTPSPLLNPNTAEKNLYFQAEVGGKGKQQTITSPQVVNSEQIASSINWSLDLEAGNKKQLRTFKDNVSIDDLQSALNIAEESERREQVLSANDVQGWAQAQSGMMTNDLAQQTISQQAEVDQQEIAQVQGAMQQMAQQTDYEYGARKSGTRQVLSQLKISKERLYNWGNNPGAPIENGNEARDKSDSPDELNRSDEQVLFAVSEEVMRPIWVRDFLMLARTVNIGGKTTIQGVWLNWEEMKKQLLRHVTEVFPEADLVRADPAADSDRSRLLASLPVKLVPGEPLAAGMPVTAQFGAPLVIAWIAVALGVLAVGGLVAGTSALSERRGAFVSAVTHELRTPLTTFRMYTEMLKEGIISDEERKQEYLDTLHRESERLGHLVENVLAYARLEKGIGSRTLEEITAFDLVERAEETLSRRADEAGMTLVADVDPQAGGRILSTDVTAVMQILFNLVDNACKYAGNADDKRIHLAVSSLDGSILFKISDHGQGLKRDELRMVFRPFRKSAEKAAQTAAGVGLGLSLCKRLARQLGGDVGYEEHREYGACFRLRLPAA